MEEHLVAQLDKIKALTLILRGTNDRMTTEESAIFVKSRIPTSHLIYMYDAGHAIEVDQPERFATLTSDFLARGLGFLVNPGSGSTDGAASRMD
jgi:pimeloyl-ACP methyl ester carboxylesterase